jgi:hypothetical protein
MEISVTDGNIGVALAMKEAPLINYSGGNPFDQHCAPVRGSLPDAAARTTH